MAWERRRNQRFFYRSIRIGRKVKKIYYGSGPRGELAALAFEEGKRQRAELAAALQRSRDSYQEVTADLDRLGNELDMLLNAEVAAARYREHRQDFNCCYPVKDEENEMQTTIPITDPSKLSKPRKKNDHQKGPRASGPQCAKATSGATNPADAKTADSAPPEKPQPPTAEFDFRELVERANQNDRDAMVELRNVLDSNPAIWQEVGDLSKHCRMTLTRLISQGDQLVFESILLKAVSLRSTATIRCFVLAL